MALLILH